MSDSKRFTKTKEDFVCANCGCAVVGDGFTNHCPKCLWSMHVDVFPGDRKATCKGLMEPTAVIVEGGKYLLEHTCLRCGHKKRNKMAHADSFETALVLSEQIAKKQHPV